MNCLDELGFGRKAFAEPMLVWVQYPMIFQMGEHAADYDMFLQLAYDGCEGYWPVVTRIVFGSLFVDWRYYGISPILRDDSCIIELLEQDTDSARKLGC